MRWLSRLTSAAVILVAVAGLVLLVRSRIPNLQSSGGFRTYAKIRDASRLAVGSPVVIAGVQVGNIDKLTIEGSLARLDMRLRDGLGLPADSFATKRADSLFGDSYIEIVPSGEADAPPLRSGEPIAHVVEGGSTDAELRSIAAAMPKIDNALDIVHDFALSGRSWVTGPLADRLTRTDDWIAEGHIEQPLTRTGDFVTALDDGSARVQRALDRGGPDFLRTLERFDTGILSARTKMTDLKTSLVGALQDTRTGLDKIDPQVQQAAEVMTAINEGKSDDWRGTLGRLVNKPDLADKVEDFTQDARDAVAGFTRFRSWIGARVEFDWYSKDVRFYASATLRARNDKFYLVEFERGPLGGLPKDALTDAVDSADYTRTQEIHDRLRFTAQIGKQIGMFAFRGGVKDSTFGAGIDALLLDGRLKLSTDVFGAFDATPRVKLTGALEVFRSIYIMAGIDDVLNTPGYLPVLTDKAGAPTTFDHVRYGRDYFAGASLQFTDEDIAMMLRIYGALLVGLLL